MDLGIKGKIAVVAAASKGLGRGVAESLAAEGCNVVICSRDEARIIETAERIKAAHHVEVLPVVCDVSRAGDIEALRQEVVARFGTCHILFTNSGGPQSGAIESFSDKDYENAFNLVLMSTVHLVYAFLPCMKSQKWGRILASTSTNVKEPLPSMALSNVSRIGVAAFIKSLAMETAAYSITANTLAPGYVMTDLIKTLLEKQCVRENISYAEPLNRVQNEIPTRSIGKPENFGALAAFLASEQASYITGETILFDGGMCRSFL
jgi:3-oxoacyl-[acyl-carrier protein] reductase